MLRSWYVLLFHLPRLPEVALSAGNHRLLRKLFRSSATDGCVFTDADLDEYARAMSQPGALTTMLNWYRASKMVVPAPGEDAKAPLWIHAPFPKLGMPTLVVWGLKDSALLPVQLGGLHDLIDDLRIVTSPTAGHFITWEEPGTVTAAIADFMAETA